MISLEEFFCFSAWWCVVRTHSDPLKEVTGRLLESEQGTRFSLVLLPDNKQALAGGRTCAQ